MPGVMDLWLPILLSAIAVFIVSSILHVALPWHRGEYKKLPNEEAVMSALRASGVARGEFMFPCAESMKDVRTPEMVEKFTAGPVGMLTVLEPGPPNMTKSLTLWFLYSLLVGVFVAYIGAFALPIGTGYDHTFRVTGTIAILGYGVGYLLDTVWKGRPWRVSIKYLVDGIIYGLFTAGFFGWLWP